MALKAERTNQSSTVEPADRERIVSAVLDEIRPSLRRDRRDCELVEIDGNKIMVRLTGACMLCKLAGTTLAAIQARLVERLGEFVRLIPLPGAAKVGH
ncbi:MULTISPECIES: NifU family protein [Bradyrhizobium]|uniref:NifU family protein n=1 Tax=Bradyrhizobium centrosematis TaxID=1300039 RepID=UPI0021671665|nr:NifU family protein [Bradyrhizobium centrosematis]MCS3764736.1 Fe-S cluster biogenesis protein NfuA [Bradyrhizobium centrosematis]MCS3776212.1 Fe-S cluster biogenesis protein NfuA [Bradyrhizobium centrosematis]